MIYLYLFLYMCGVYVTANAVGYVVHRLLHNPFMGRAFRDHYFHHVKLYPPDDYLSDEYREPPEGAGQGKYYIGALLVLFSPTLLLGWPFYLIAVAQSTLVLYVNAWLHDALHIREHFLERYKWFHHLREVHFVHHVDVKKNFGIFDFTADKVCGTLEK